MANEIALIFYLLVFFQIKHFIADFPLQREYMMKKTLAGWAFVPPLAVHCGVHAVFTFAMLMVVLPHMWWLCFVDFSIHFVMDRLKAGPKYLGRFNDRDKHSFWIAFGFDQMVHHLTDYLIIYLIVLERAKLLA